MTMANSTDSASRIPVTLRRSSSLRQKGERCYNKAEHQQQLQLQQQQRHRHDLFPAITENADAARTDTKIPLRRASSNASLQQLTASPHFRRSGPRRSAEDSSDLDSVRSFGSNCSNLSVASTSACDHAHFALNGTTWSARSRRYVVHCSPQHRGCDDAADSPDQYLTPTQRTARQLRHLQVLLKEARQELDERDHEVARLTKELVELRLLKAETAEPPPPPPLLLPDKPPSPVDEDVEVDSGFQPEVAVTAPAVAAVDPLVGCHFERRIDEMQRRHQDELQLLKQAHHDRLEALLGQLADMSARYCEAQPALERAQARERQMQAELEELRQQLRHNHELLADQEERNKRTYLELYAKGEQAARLEQQDQQQTRQDDDSGGGGSCCSAKVTVAELLRQLTVTQAELDNVKDSCYAPQHLSLACRSPSLLSLQEAVTLWVLGMRKAMYRRILESRNKQSALDPEITLQFLKSAIYYFLTDKENLQGHLNAIESILGFTDTEKLNIDKIYRAAKK